MKQRANKNSYRLHRRLNLVSFALAFPEAPEYFFGESQGAFGTFDCSKKQIRNV